MADDNVMTLAYTIPKKCPPWVEGFSDWLRTSKNLVDGDVLLMRETWRKYHKDHWAEFQAAGKQRKPKAKKAELELDPKPDERVPTQVRRRLKVKLANMRRLAEGLANAQLLHLVDEMENELDTN